MIPSHPFGPFASDELADAAEELAAKMRHYRDLRFDRPCELAARVSEGVAELLVASAMLRRSPVAQQRLVEYLLEKRHTELRGYRRDFDA